MTLYRRFLLPLLLTSISNLFAQSEWVRTPIGDSVHFAKDSFFFLSPLVGPTSPPTVVSIDLMEFVNIGTPSKTLFDAAWGSNVFVALGASTDFPSRPQILVSSNGLQWISATKPAHQLSAVTFGSGRFAAVGNGGSILNSTDGLVWEEQLVGSDDLSRIKFGGEQFVSVGRNGMVAHSPDGLIWQSSPITNAGNLSSIAYGNGVYLSAGDGVFLSSDAVTWTDVTPADFEGNGLVAFGNGRFVATSDTNVFVSTTGRDWALYPTTNVSSSLVFGHGQFVCAGAQQDSSIRTSVDGISWKLLFQVPKWLHNFGTALTAGPQGFLTASGKQPLFSSDGHVWTLGPDLKNVLVGSTYGNGEYVMTGVENSLSAPGIIARSPDGTNWISLKGPDLVQPIAFGNGRFVAIDPLHFVAFTSLDLTNWTRSKNLSRGNPYKVTGLTFCGEQFFVVGPFMRMQVSSNGTDWAIANISATGVAGGPQGLVAVNSNNSGETFYSTNGLNWVQTMSPRAGALQAVTYGAGVFVASGANGAVLVSNDGQTWNRRQTYTQRSIDSIAYGSGLFVGFGTDPIIICSQLTNLKIEPSDGSSVVLHVRASSSAVKIENSSDLLTWSVLRDFPNGTLGEAFQLNVNGPSAFQRISWP